jgi:hypothetical protein
MTPMSPLNTPTFFHRRIYSLWEPRAPAPEGRRQEHKFRGGGRGGGEGGKKRKKVDFISESPLIQTHSSGRGASFCIHSGRLLRYMTIYKSACFFRFFPLTRRGALSANYIDYIQKRLLFIECQLEHCHVNSGQKYQKIFFSDQKYYQIQSTERGAF